MIRFVSKLPYSRTAWLILSASSLALLIAALVFQYAHQMPPCVHCIYIRVAVAAIALSGMIALLNPRWLMFRLIGLLGWLSASAWGLYQAIILMLKQRPKPADLFFLESCDLIPNFPSWLPLHQWLPQVFRPSGGCEDAIWHWMGLSMAEWMIVAFGLYLFAGLVVGRWVFFSPKADIG